MACNCKGGKAPSAPPNGLVQSSVQESAARLNSMSITDSDFEMVTYMHPNKGQHPVYGGATGRSYGFRAGGGSETFLVHRSDIAASPNYFIVAAKTPSPPKVEIQPPAPPVPIVEPKVATIEEPVRIEEPRVSPTAEAIAKKRAMNQLKFDLQLLPGVTPAMAKSMIASGLITPEKIIEAGVSGLEEVKFLGEKRARAIFDYVNENYGQPTEV